MGIIRLSSNHPKFSYLIRKRPESGITVVGIKDGAGFGWFSTTDNAINESEYNVYFEDYSKASYGQSNSDHSVAYLNRGRYVDPHMYLDLVEAFFDLPKIYPDGLEDIDGVYQHKLTVSCIYIEKQKIINYFRKANMKITFTPLEKQNQYGSLIIETSDSLRSLISYFQLFLMMNLVTSNPNGAHYAEIGFPIDRLVKYAELIKQQDLDFYIRYIFSRNLLRNKKNFAQVQPILEASTRYKIQLQYGDTATQRYNFVEKHLVPGLSVLDVGCGEGAYLKLCPDLKKSKLQYYGVDTDPEVLDAAQHKLKVKEYENAYLYSKLDDALESIGYAPAGENLNVILIEVIEHMPLSEAENLIRKIVESSSVKRLIVTTPNADFNKFYDMDPTNKRHADHHWEMSDSEFTSWLQQFTPTLKRATNIQQVPIGDQVNGVSTTQGVIMDF